MAPFGSLLRQVLHWLERYLPERAVRLLRPASRARQTPSSMAGNRQRAIAAWEQLVRQHAPHLLQESAPDRAWETPFQWPRMPPFSTARQRSWPATPNTPSPDPVHQHCKHDPPGSPESSRKRAWTSKAQPYEPPAKARRPEYAHPEPTRHPFCQGELRHKPIGCVRQAVSPAPAPTSQAQHQRWQHPVTTEENASQAPPFEGASQSPATESHLHSAEAAPVSSNADVLSRNTSPLPESAPLNRGHESLAPEPPASYGESASHATPPSETHPQHSTWPWLETPVPETDHVAPDTKAPEPAADPRRGTPWPELPDTPAPPGIPRPEWTTADHRQRLFDEQKGVL